MTLVCAPPGSGKTQLLRAWASELGEPVAWVTVDRGERDGQRFTEELSSQLAVLDHPLVLIVDDLHELRASDAVASLELLLAHQPPQLRIVLATREDPGLGLHRARVSGRLVELRAADLRFTREETAALLRAGGIVLSDEGVAALNDRTEGWAAGLRLAAISLAGHPDPERFVAEFSGSERTVAGYLVAEVLDHQPSEVRDLLLRTSILERVSGPLADALTGAAGAEAILQRLEDQNAFVTALDAGRTWFRYHHLFADLLRLELRRVTPTIVPSLHRSAARWHEQQGDVVEAVRHAQAAEDWAHAARLLAGDGYVELRLSGRSETAHALLEAFPPDAYQNDANLAATLAIDRAVHGLLDQSAAYLGVAERLFDTTPGESVARFRLHVAGTALALARRRADLPAARDAIRRFDAARAAITEAGEPPVSPCNRALALMNLGITELWSLHPDEARRDLETALTIGRQISQAFIEIECLAHLAMATPLTGQPLPFALELSEQALAIAEERGWAGEPVAAAAYAMAGMLLVRLARFAEAEPELERGERALHGIRDPGTVLVLHHSRGLLRLGQGRCDEALAAFERAQRCEALGAREHMLMVELRSRTLQTKIRLGQTRFVRRALSELDARERGRAGMRITDAALALLADDDAERAIDTLAPVVGGTTQALHERWAQIEAVVLQAVAYDRLGERRAAEAALEQSLELTEPEGMLLAFTLWPVRGLLERHPRHRTAHGTLLTTILDVVAGAAPAHNGSHTHGADELSAAELRVVRYLPSNLNASEIASELFVSANTIRTHLRHIYGKLDVHTRSEAVTRARELGVLGPALLRR